jgi:hypothetical protein
MMPGLYSARKSLYIAFMLEMYRIDALAQDVATATLRARQSNR